MATVTQDGDSLVSGGSPRGPESCSARSSPSPSCQKTKRKSVLATTPRGPYRVPLGGTRGPLRLPGPSQPGPGRRRDEARSWPARARRDPARPRPPGTTSPAVPPTEDFLPLPTGFLQCPGAVDLEMAYPAFPGVFCPGLSVFLINCIVFVLRYRHKRIPLPSGQHGSLTLGVPG